MNTETTTNTTTETVTTARLYHPDFEGPYDMPFDIDLNPLTAETAEDMARRFHKRSGLRAVAIRKTTTITTTVETVVLYDSDASA